jgi:hypothetical protein
MGKLYYNIVWVAVSTCDFFFQFILLSNIISLFFWLDPKEPKDQGCRNCSAYATRPRTGEQSLLLLHILFLSNISWYAQILQVLYPALVCFIAHIFYLRRDKALEHFFYLALKHFLNSCFNTFRNDCNCVAVEHFDGS